MTDTTKMYVQRSSGTTLHQTRCWLNADAEEQLRELRGHYETLLGRSVSTSLIMRRAIGILAEHTRSAKGAPQEELAALARIML